MGFFKKKRDPISERARSLQEQITALEAQIVQLHSQVQAQGGPDAPAREGAAAGPPAQSPVPKPEPAAEPPADAGSPPPAQPRLRSTALPHGPTIISQPSPAPPTPTPAPAPAEPVFEALSRNPFKAPGEPPEPVPQPELGVRKSDFAGFWRRLRNHFRGPATSNPKLVSYLAAGSLQGLRPLRYEKRVARNRFIALMVFLFLVLWWLVVILLKH